MWKRAKEEYEPGYVEPPIGTGERLLVIQIAISVAFAIYASMSLRGIRDVDIPSYLHVFEGYVSAIVPHIRIHTSVLAGSIYESQIPFFRLTVSLIWGFNIIVGLIQIYLIPKIARYYKKKIEFFKKKRGDNAVFAMNLGAYLIVAMGGISVWDGALTYGPLGSGNSSPTAILSMSNFVFTAIFSAALAHSICRTIALLFCKLRAKQD